MKNTSNMNPTSTTLQERQVSNMTLQAPKKQEVFASFRKIPVSLLLTRHHSVLQIV